MVYKALLLLTTLAVSIYAESYLGLSYPLGLPLQNASGTIRGMGGAGTGLKDEFAAFSANPANMAMPNKSSFSAVVSMNYYAFKDKTTDYSSNTTPSFLSFILPLGQLGNIGVSLDKKTEGQLSFRSSSSLENNNRDSVYTGLLRDGGLTSWQGGWGYLFKNGLSIGLTYQRLYNELTTDKIQGYISEAPENHSSIIQNNIISFPANGIRGGILVPIKKLEIGLAGEYIFAAEGTEKAKDLLQDTTVTTTSKISVHLPPSAQLGLAYRFNQQWLAAADLSTTLWSRYISDIETDGDLRSTYSASAGVRYTPISGPVAHRYSETIHYRAGIRYSQMPVEGASERALTVGIGLPVQEEKGLIDFVFEMGKRRNEQFKDFSESFYSIHLGINSRHKWFERTRDNY